MTAGEVYAFTGLAAVLTITPGADMALVARSALGEGRRAAFATTLGISTGLAVHAVASALGLSAVLMVSADAYTALRLAGAAYLVWLGVQALRRGAVDRAVAGAERAGLTGTAARSTRAFRQGLLTNVLNPKVALFYLTLLPQFVAPDDPALLASLALAGIHVAMGLVWLTAYAYVLGGWRSALERPSVRRALDVVTGGLLVALGLRLALERR